MASTDLVIELGDFIKIISPTKPMYDEKIFLVDYIDDDVIELVDIESADRFSIDLYDDGRIMDEHILSIHLLSRSEEPGYARQHGLLPGMWINIEFAADLDLTIMGQIVELVEDRIQVIPKNDTKSPIYIDFAYQGIPKTLPINNISVIEAPTVQESLTKLSEIEAVFEESPKQVATLETTPTGEIVLNMPENPTLDRNMFNVIKDIYIQADAIVFGKAVTVEIEEEVNRSEQRYGIDIQLNNLLDELLSSVPTHARTQNVMERVKRIVNRFKELRSEYSVFDEYGNILSSKNFTPIYKPLAEQLKQHKGVRWIVPVSNQTTKLYDIPENQFVEAYSLADDLANYKNALETNDANNRYVTFYKRIDNMFKPFLEGPDSQIVEENIEAIITSLDDYSSAVYKKHKSGAKLAKQRFVIQRYNLGMTKISKQLMRSGKYVYMREKITDDDQINPKSIIILPQPMIEASRTCLPGTDILSRTNLSKNWPYYFRILNKKTEMKRVKIPKDGEVNYDRIMNNPFMTHIIDFKGIKTQSYSDFIQSVIPRSVAIIRMMKNTTQKYNFHDMVATLEPFLIYRDNLTYSGRLYNERAQDKMGGPYKEIIAHIKNKIKEYTIRFEQRRREYANLATIKSEKPLSSSLLDIFKSANTNHFLKYYGLDDSLSNTSSLNKIVAADGGDAYTSLVAFMMASLYTPELATMEDKEDKAITNSKSCVTRVIAKKYTSLTALQKDNGKEAVYFDRDYDNTPYKILEKYRGKQKSQSPEEFMEYLRMVLIAEHGARSDLAKEMAETIVAKRKQVTTGNYAVLVEYPQPDESLDIDSLSEEESKSILTEADIRKRIHYYVRKNDHWVKDATMTDQEISNELFCNIENRCFYDTLAGACDSDAAAAKRMKAIARKSIGGEYDATIKLSLHDYQNQVRARLENNFVQLKRLQRIHAEKREQFTRYAHQIGTTAIFSEVVVSPYANLFSLILKQNDFAKKQQDIVRFKGLYCREAVDNDVATETPYWYYCRETNVKLMPTFIHILANTFVSGNFYSDVLEWLCSQLGRLSDDGESIVDRHSGYEIKKLDYSDEEGFDDAGFRINTRDILEPDEYEMVREIFERNDPVVPTKRMFENDANAFIYSVSNAICENMDIRYEDIEADIMNLTTTFLGRKTMSRDVYEAKMSKIEVKDGKKSIPYDKYLNRNVVLYAAAITFIVIQTHTPSYKPKKSFPGCKYSLTGYPLDITGDATGMAYLGCIMNAMKSKTVEPWKSIYKSDQTALDYTTMVTDIIKTKLAEENEIVRLLEVKRDYIKMTPEQDEIPMAHTTAKWVLFQPPIIPISVVKGLTGLASGYETELKATMAKGHRDQHKLLGTMYKKIIEHSYGVIEEVNAVVAVEGREAMLRAGTVVFLENACCDESFKKSSAISYFAERRPTIMKNVDFVRKYGELYSEFSKLVTPSFLSSGQKRPLDIMNPATDRFSEDAIYGAYIHYCKLDSELPIPDDIRTFCQEKPPGLEHMSRAQMIDHLKDARHTQSEASLSHLMKLVAHRNRVAVSLNEEKIPKFMDHFAGLKLDPLITHVNDFLTGKQKVSVLAEFLTEINDVMKEQIETYVKSFGNRPARGISRINSYLSLIMTWNNDQMTHDFIRASLFMMSRVLSSMLEDSTGNIGSKNMAAMKHWNLSQKHEGVLTDMITKYFNGLNLYRRDELICKLFSTISQKTHTLYSLNVFLENMPRGLSTVILNKIYTYCYYSAFYEIITESDKDLYAKINIELAKEAHRQNEMEVVAVNNRPFKERVCDLLIIMLETDIDNKKIADVNYEMLSDKYHKDALTEKNKIIVSLGNMEVDERGVENLLKKYKLGKWNLGIQKGIFQYDKTLQDTELDAIAAAEEHEAVDAMGLAQMETQVAQAEEDAEVNNMDFGEDYADGNYYDEDRDRDFE